MHTIMTLTAHSIIAAAIASKVTSPIIGLPLVLASHFLVDKIPHWDVMTSKNKSNRRIAVETSIDIILGFSVAAAFWIVKPGVDPAYFFTAVLFSQLPDLLEAPYIFPKFNNPVSKGVYKFQHFIHDLWFDARMPAPWGFVTQIGVTAAFLLWALI